MSDDGDADRDTEEQEDLQRAIDRLEHGSDGDDAGEESREPARSAADPEREERRPEADAAAEERAPLDETGAADGADPDDEPSAPDGADSTPDATPADADDPSPDDADQPDGPQPVDAPDQPAAFVPEDVAEYDRFEKIDGGTYERANEFLRDRTYITAREWALARLCADFRTDTGVEMTKIGEHLPELVPFMTDTYSPQAVNEARTSFEDKVRTAGATFLYGAMSGFFTADELDDLMYESTEVAKFLLEVEGVELSVEDELDTEERISSVMREVRESSTALRHDRATCPDCGHEFELDAE